MTNIDTDMTPNDESEPRFRTRAEAEVEIARQSMRRSSGGDFVKDDIERLEEQRDEIEEQLDDLPDEERRKKNSPNSAEERGKTRSRRRGRRRRAPMKHLNWKNDDSWTEA